jgi:4'-phosphopantetheinyl transferase
VTNEVFDNQRLLKGDVLVWRTTPDVDDSILTKHRSVLSRDEEARAERFYFAADRRRATVGRGCLRLLLARTLMLPACRLSFAYDDFGKPSLKGKPRGLEFNVSHSGNVILIAMARQRPVGVDVERIRTNFDPIEIAKNFFSAREQQILASLIGAAQYEAFFACWTRKEAYLKAKGVGLSLPLDQFDVSLLPCEEPKLLATRPDAREAKHWSLRALDFSRDYAAAVVAAGSDWKLGFEALNPLSLVGDA